MAAYYNEIDPYAAQWLRNLIAAGHIAPGDVDERSIEDVHPDDLKPYNQCHFFAGVGVWSYALRRAGWPDDGPVWTGSCPCQPFSAAGAGTGFDDKRHLWPHFHWLISECQPAIVFGEQVASKDAEPWLDLVQADVEALAYAFGAVAFPSAGVGAPHIRDRTYWVADSESLRRPRQYLRTRSRMPAIRASEASGIRGLANANSDRQSPRGLPVRPGQQGQAAAIQSGSSQNVQPGPVNGLWADADWLFCRDGKWRPVEPGTFPLAHGAPSRVGRLRAYGNAINAEAAAHFIAAYLETL